MKHKNLIIVGLIALAVIVILVTSLFKETDTNAIQEKLKNQEVSVEEPLDIVLDFYESWLQAKQSTSTNPYLLELAQNPLLSVELRDDLATAHTDSDQAADPVLCLTTVPEKIKVKPVFELDNSVQFVVSAARDKVLTGQSTVTLVKHNEGWYIDNISCSDGESAPEREFSFEKEGNLLKSVPPPLDSQYWHIVYVANGQNGHAAPLFFSEESVCIEADGSESVCNTERFTDAIGAFVQGEMIEAGINVRRLQLR
jgi:hypothetical protein